MLLHRATIAAPNPGVKQAGPVADVQGVDRLQVRFYPDRVRPPSGDGGALTPSQAVRLVREAGQVSRSDKPRAYAAPPRVVAAAHAEVDHPGQPTPWTGPRHAVRRRGWFARIWARLRG